MSGRTDFNASTTSLVWRMFCERESRQVEDDPVESGLRGFDGFAKGMSVDIQSERRYQSRVVSTLMRRAQELGYKLVKNEDLPAPLSPA
jgi:hypothetical protein